MPHSTDAADATIDLNVPRPVSQAQLAALANRSRSTVSEACRGPLAPACMEGGSINVASPCVALWAGVPREKLVMAAVMGDRRPLRAKPKPGPQRRSPAEPKRSPRPATAKAAHAADALPDLVIDDARRPDLDVFAAAVGVPVDELRTGLAAALVPAGHVSALEFAARAGEDVETIKQAVRGPLRAALTPSGRLDLGHVASLEYMAQRPFPAAKQAREQAAEVCDETAIALFGSCLAIDGMADLDHPATRAFLARCWGRVPTDEMLDRAVDALRGAR
jgi:hypothetical protein